MKISIPCSRPKESLAGIARQSAFTMVEIALCLAIVGFALVAIIGVLPTGMNVQRDNREETIISQDAAVWLDAIRNGSQGYDDLTNYVVAITNRVQLYTSNGVPSGGVMTRVYTPANYLTNGLRIIGLLSTPRYVPVANGNYESNYVVAIVRALSGSAVEKKPQDNADILEGAFAYRMIVENTPYLPAEFGTNRADLVYQGVLEQNSRDLRLTFRWPVLPRGMIGNGRQTFRVFCGGGTSSFVDDGERLFFFQPQTYLSQ